ncbi:MAG: hypothetical protein GXP10_11390 [Gammaproteobacteria bacterium]|nr:hypothetical protein [Gammaproteobacteria bacterium]
MSRRRVVFCTYSSVYSSIVLKELLQSDDIEVVAIINSTRIFNPKYGWLKGACELISRCGFRYAFQQFCLTDLFVLLRPLVSLKPIQCDAQRLAIPVHDTKNINSEQSVRWLRDLKPDILLSAYFNQRIDEPVLAIPQLGCLNVHPSPLPAYRGVDPVFYALHRSESELGVTLHLLDKTFDTGNILQQMRLPVMKERSVFYHYAALFKMGALMAVEQIKLRSTGDLGAEQCGDARYDSWPKRTVVKSFIQQGGKLIAIRDYFSVLRKWV